MREQKSDRTVTRGGATGSGFGCPRKVETVAKVEGDRKASEDEGRKRADKARAKPEEAK